MEAFETVEMSTDLLIVGGGMAACGAAFEASYWAKKNNLSVLMVDKAAVDRSGAVAMGLSAINTYIGVGRGENTPEDFVQYVKMDQMGTIREDLVYDIPVTLTPRYICSRNGDSPSGRMPRATISALAVGKS
jgi:adenylylsulfate reductase subunit A